MDTLEERDIAKVRLFLVDIFGHPKFMIIPRDYLEEVVDGINIDGSSIKGFTTVNKSDIIAKPDVTSVTFLGDEAVIFCDIYEEGQLFERDPRGILKKVLKGNSFLVKPELEFYLLRGKAPLDTHGYMDTGEGLPLIEEAVCTLDVAVERIHHENGPGQYEIEPVMAPAVKACDTIILLKEVLKQKAEEKGVTATFMPKPLAGVAGSGMHFHILMEDEGKNAFDVHTCAQHFIGGLLSHAKGMTAVLNPTINSYKRLVPHYEAPVYIAWGRENRSALVRIPEGGRTRIEYRAPDPLCNPYLALAVMVGAGLDGIKKQIEPPPEVTDNIFSESNQSDLETLPASLEKALGALEKDTIISAILGGLQKEFITLKKKEIQHYKTHISQWELEHYL